MITALIMLSLETMRLIIKEIATPAKSSTDAALPIKKAEMSCLIKVAGNMT